MYQSIKKKLESNFFWANLSQWFGALYFFSGAVNKDAYLVSGPIMIFGAAAYKSAQRRRLGLAKSSAGRLVLEILAIVIIFLMIFLQKDVKVFVVEDPVPNVIIPAWALTAYCTAILSDFFARVGKWKIILIIGLFVLLSLTMLYVPYLIFV